MQEFYGTQLEFQEILENLVRDEQSQTKNTHLEISSKIGISNGTLSKYLNGTTPDLKNLIKISDYYHTSLDYLVGRVNYRTTKKNLKSAIETTGLSEQAIDHIIKLDKVMRSVLNYFLSHPSLNSFLSSMFATSIAFSVCEQIKKDSESEQASGDSPKGLTTNSDLVFAIADEKLVLEEYKRDKLAKSLFDTIVYEIAKNDKAINAFAAKKKDFLFDDFYRENPQTRRAEETT